MLKLVKDRMTRMISSLIIEELFNKGKHVVDKQQNTISNPELKATLAVDEHFSFDVATRNLSTLSAQRCLTQRMC